MAKYRENLKWVSHWRSQDIKENAIDLLNELDAEDNLLIRHWKQIGIIPISAAESQSLIHLKNEYCDKRLCLSCAIGHAILRGNT